MNHTPEPWRIYSHAITNSELMVGPTIHIPVATIHPRGVERTELHKTNARRIVACVNACASISTEMLETGVLQELLEACKFMAQDYYCRMNPAQMPTLAKRAFDTFTGIEAAKDGGK